MSPHRIFLQLPLLSLALSQPSLVMGQTIAPVDSTQPADSLPGSSEESSKQAPKSGEILVIADRIKGQVDAPQKPIETLNEEDIAAYGATSVAGLLAALTPQTGSGRGRGGAGGGFPVMLLNGQRVSSFREMRNIPPEAIKRVEILPEEVALRYGFAPNQRVVNMILKDNFAAKTFELEYDQPDRGGSMTRQLEASLFAINGPRRLNLTVTSDDTSPLTEGERDVTQVASSLPSVSTDPDPAFGRTLIADSSSNAINGTWSVGLGSKGMGGSITLNGTVTRAGSLALSGFNTVTLTAPGGARAVRTFGDPLARSNQSMTLQGGAALNKPLGTWQLTASLDATHSDSDSRIDRRADTGTLIAAAAAGSLLITGPLPTSAKSGADRALSVNDSLTSLITLVGRPFHLPGGDVTLTLKGGYNFTGIVSEDTRSIAGRTQLKRNDLLAGFNLGIPLTSRREGFLDEIGDLSLNYSGGINHLSDFGTLYDWSAGLTWAPTEKLGLQASYIVNSQAPGLGQLGNPVTVSFNVPIYDFVRGETVLVTVTGGGNPLLRKETDRDFKLGANWQLPFLKGSSLIVEYFRNNSSNVTESFPVLTPAIEAAFPGRVTRDGSGRLIALDRRPVFFASEKASRLRWGLNLSGPIGKVNPMQQAMMERMARGGGGGGGRGPGGPGGGAVGGPRGGGGGFGPMMGGPGMPGGQGRFNVSIYHTMQFENRVLVAPGGPVLDLLDGDALSGGGVARHSLEMEGGAFYKGMGVRLSGSYTAPTRIDGTGAPGAGDLRFGGLAKLNFRMFMELSQQKWLGKSAFLKGFRVSFHADNIFDARQRVLDQNGVVPISYQPDILDPKGRFIGFELRKQF